MRIFKDWFIVKRPYTQVTKKSEEFMKKYPPEMNDRRELLMRKVGYEDGYAACLMDLGIKQTRENINIYGKTKR